MSLPRNIRAKNTNKHLKIGPKQEVLRKINQLNNLCEKYKIGPLTFREAKYVTSDNKTAFLHHREIKGNLRDGVLLIQVSELPELEDTTYDLIDLETAKKERDIKKKQEEDEQARIELERLQKLEADKMMVPSNCETNCETNSGAETVTELTNENVTEPQIESPAEFVDKSTDEKSNEKQPSEEQPIQEHNTEHNTETSKKNRREKPDRSSKAKRERAVQRMREQLAKRAMQNPFKQANNLITNLKSVCTVKALHNVRFLDLKKETTSMVINGVRAYELIMPKLCKEKYLLFVGDLQLKSQAARQIDPAYKADKVYEEQLEFLERIKAMEGNTDHGEHDKHDEHDEHNRGDFTDILSDNETNESNETDEIVETPEQEKMGEPIESTNEFDS